MQNEKPKSEHPAQPSDNLRDVDSTRLLDFQMIPVEQLKGAAILVIRMEPRECLSFDEGELQMLIGKMPKGGVVLFMEPGQSLETITEEDMRGLGWVKSNARGEGRP